MIHYAQINKTQQKQLDSYIKKLNITTDGERFVLEHILKRDWGRDILLEDIEMIKYNHKNCSGLIWVKCNTRNGSYNFQFHILGLMVGVLMMLKNKKNMLVQTFITSSIKCLLTAEYWRCCHHKI